MRGGDLHGRVCPQLPDPACLSSPWVLPGLCCQFPGKRVYTKYLGCLEGHCQRVVNVRKPAATVPSQTVKGSVTESHPVLARLRVRRREVAHRAGARESVHGFPNGGRAL